MSHADAPAASFGGAGPLAVLVVDDAPEDVEIVRRHLGRAVGRAYAVRHVALGADALAALGNPAARPDVVLLDYGLPDMTGLDLLDALAAAGDEAGGGAGGKPGGLAVPVVMLSVATSLQMGVAALRRGALDYLDKTTLTSDALRSALDGAVARFAAARLVTAQRATLAETNARLSAATAALEERTAAAERARAHAEAAQRAAEAARADADRANRAKSEFLATMSHELRTPLNAIGGYAELLQLGIRGPVTPEQVADLERVTRAQRHLLGLINGVLNYAKIDAGAVHYDIAEMPLDEVLRTCEALVSPQVRAKGLTCAYDRADAAAADGRPLHVRGDREKVQQVVLNLLSNAVKFTEPGGQVTLAARGADPQVVVVTVADTGVGIAPDQVARVFEPFVQVDTAYTRTQGGTGLGLAISRDLARGMGGDLTAESTPGVGSTFTLTLPAA